MIVPFSVNDFLDRALAVYGDRIGIVDEPDQPAPSLGDLTYAPRRRAGAGDGGQARPSSASTSATASPSSRHNSARLFTAFWGVCGYGRVLVPVNFRLSFDEVQYIVEHSGARVLYVDPELEDALAGPRGRARVRDRRRRRPVPRGRSSRGPGSPTRTPRRRSTTPPARPPGRRACRSPTATSGPTRVTFALHAGVTDRDVYLHTLPMFHANGWGMPFAMAGLRRAPGRAAQGRRRRDPAPGRAARRHRHVRGAGRRRRGARRGARLGGRDPRPRPDPDHRRRCAAADRRPWRGSRPSSAGSSSRSTASPRPRRCSPSTGRGRSGTTSPPEERAPEAGPRRDARRSA